MLSMNERENIKPVIIGHMLQVREICASNGLIRPFTLRNNFTEYL